jgi:hypothetical protein
MFPVMTATIRLCANSATADGPERLLQVEVRMNAGQITRIEALSAACCSSPHELSCKITVAAGKSPPAIGSRFSRN